MTLTNSNNKRDNDGNTKAPNMPTNKTGVATSKGQPAKGTTQNGGAEGSKESLGLIQQDRTKCAAGAKCKAVACMPLNTHHRCAVCNYCLHGDCGIEQKETEKNKAPFSHKAICFVCIDHIQAGQLIKLDKTQGTQFISLGQHKVIKLIQSVYKLVKLIDPVPFNHNDDTDYSSDNPDIFIAGKNPEYNVTAEDINGNIKATNTTKNTNNTTTTQPEPQKNPPKTSPLKETTAIDEDSDEDTVDVGNSRATPHSSTPKNAKSLLVSSRLERTHSNLRYSSV
jgi:hypothetical protein